MLDLAQGGRGNWDFDPRAVGMKDEIVQAMKDAIDANRENFKKHLGNLNEKDLNAKLSELKEKLNDFVSFVEY